MVGPRSRSRPGRCVPKGARQWSGGYNLVLLTMVITVLQVTVAAALPKWSHLIQREREEELIFRGLQYAEAIRVFKIRFGRDPVRLKELIEVEPRSIRQLWENPMTEDGEWGILDPAGNPYPRIEGEGASPAGEVVAPIGGVYSPKGGEAIKTFLQSTEIGAWRFTPALLQSGGGEAPPPGVGINPAMLAGGTVVKNSGDFWRPFPPGVGPGGIAPVGQQGPQGQGGFLPTDPPNSPTPFSKEEP